MPTGFSIGHAIPPAPVDAPVPGAPTQYGLFVTARMQDNAPRHELNGIEYEPVCSTRVDEWPMNCTPYRGAEDGPGVHDGARDLDPMPWPKGTDEGPRWPYGRKHFEHSTGVTRALPFTLYAGEDCFLGNHDQEQAQADLRERFKLGEQAAAEWVIYNGAMDVVPAIRYRPTILTAEGAAETPIAPVDGIGLLEHWLECDSGALGVIHAPRYMAAFLGGGHTIRAQGQRAMSPLGHSYLFGAGYSGEAPFDDEGPAEETPGKVWLYATRPLTVRRSALIEPADFESGAFSKPRNEASLLVERIYVIDWPCEVAAVQVDFPRYRLSTRPVHPDENEQQEQ